MLESGEIERALWSSIDIMPKDYAGRLGLGRHPERVHHATGAIAHVPQTIQQRAIRLKREIALHVELPR